MISYGVIERHRATCYAVHTILLKIGNFAPKCNFRPIWPLFDYFS